MHAKHGTRQTKFVSFSGIDGAGKSTQIQRFHAKMEQAGLRCQVVSFWDEIAQFKALRESASHKVFKGDRGVGAPDAPIARRDKNVRSWWMTAVRLCIYAADAVAMRLAIKKLSRSKADIVIFDRFIYDELANLNLENAVMRFYAQIMTKLVPRPNVSFLIDAIPAEARARKPEYPLEFLEFSRENYLTLSEMTGCITVIAPSLAGEVEQEVLNCAETALFVPADRGASDRSERLVEIAR
jgi:thymidylate kinase